MNRTLELPEPIYNTLVEAARAGGVSPADWIAARLPGPTAPAAALPLREARERLWGHVVALGHPTGVENEAIDADLARAYLDPPARKPLWPRCRARDGSS